MKTISVPVEIKVMLEELGDGKSINEVMELLLDSVDIPDEDEKSKNMGRINIWINQENLDKLKKLKNFPTETYGSIIYRLLQNHQK